MALTLTLTVTLALALTLTLPLPLTLRGEALEPPSALTELTPVAIQAGRLLARRLFGAPGGKQMDYRMVPTTVFTPIEYGCVGYTEEGAVAEFGAENLEVFHQYYQPLEWRLVKSRADRSAFVKLIVHKADSDRVVGMHVCGPHAGETTVTYLLTYLPILCPALT